MLVVMSGLPQSGKTVVATQLMYETGCDYVYHIDLDDYRLPELENACDEDRSQAGIAAWNVAFDDAMASLEKNPPDRLIIFDTCAASWEPISDLGKFAQKHHHKVVTIFVACHVDTCAKRCKKNGIPPSVVSRYFDKFKDTLPMLKGLSDKFFAVKNYKNKSKIDLSSALEWLKSNL